MDRGGPRCPGSGPWDASAAARRALYLGKGAVDRDYLALEMGPLLDLVEAVGRRRQDEFDNALAAAAQAYDEWYSAEDRQRDPLVRSSSAAPG